MSKAFYQHLTTELTKIDAAGLSKSERVITSHQSAKINVQAQAGTPPEVINFCANNYLGLADSPQLVAAAKAGLDSAGFGMASVRFICGTQSVHQKLERELSEFFGKQDSLLYVACFDANGGLFEPLFGPEDAIISDSLNHASIIDGVRLCKAKRYRYANNDMADLAAKLQQADKDGARHKIIATDGVFSMDGIIANLPAICDLADQYGAITMVDDSHAVGFMGQGGRGTPEHCGVLDRVDILTGTLGKALGGAAGGYVSGRREVLDMLRQRSRPYLFSNALPPMLCTAGSKALELVRDGAGLRKTLFANANRFRAGMSAAGFDLTPGEHPIIPVMLGDAKLAQEMAAKLLLEGIYVIGFSFPVVPKGQARIRTQMSAAHTSEQIDFAIAAFIRVGKKLGVIK
ncbi:2-amino-3-ketobutyrate coenzyme A ligase [hydrothermal vent metagenome]|uniref:2-amino-3-ketobutyrate coenzyme A ligase n=1 Tax=hydrothermal vent metagenome TaxID=652676 RepID=A0A3B0R5G2_9ZZZZ